MALVVSALKAMQGIQIVIVMDTAKPQLFLDVIRAAGDLGLWSLVIPAGLTYFVQPLDVCVFASHEAELKASYLQFRARRHGSVDAEQ